MTMVRNKSLIMELKKQRKIYFAKYVSYLKKRKNIVRK